MGRVLAQIEVVVDWPEKHTLGVLEIEATEPSPEVTQALASLEAMRAFISSLLGVPPQFLEVKRL